MKTILLILTLGFFSCSTDKSPETQLYDCWVQSFKEYGVDLASEIQDFENDLITNGYLKDNSWSSYKKLIDSLSHDTLPMIGRTIKMIEFSQATFQVDKQCSDSAIISQIPKLDLLNTDFQRGIDNKDLGYRFIYSKISSTIDKNDFNTDLYKTWINWILISNSIYSNWLKDLIPKDNPDEKISMIIKIDSLNNYYIADKLVDLNTIKTELKNIGDSDSKLKIGLKSHKSVTMDKIVEIMNLCRDNNLQIKLETSE